MSNDIYTVTREDLIELVNQARELFVQVLEENEVLDSEKAQELLQYTIVIAKKSMLGRFWDKLFTSTQPRFVIVKVLPKYNSEEVP
jgi:hypothetical protein